MNDENLTSEVPNGLKHIGFIAAANRSNRSKSEPFLKEKSDYLEVLGTALNALYTSATCHRGCKGGDHTLEALGSRVYNLSCASYTLISVGFYDEALNLVRSIGEIANLLSLSLSNNEKFSDWLKSTKPERLKKFSPAKVRSLLKNNGIVIMDGEWYAELCESYTHVTPQTSPNNYDLGRNICGGIIQQDGASKAIDQLTNLVAVVALYYCRYSNLDDLFEDLAAKFQALE